MNFVVNLTDKLRRNIIPICYFGFYIIFGLSLLIVQPFGDPPDEYNRFLIPRYIAKYGALPNGYDEEIRIGGYGFSYGFQPILPYIIQGGAVRVVKIFTEDEMASVYAARSVNFLFGLLMAVVVLLLSREWFKNRKWGWLFAFLVVFLPQSIFMHTYVNTDSCCLLSTALMLYGLTLGLKDGFKIKSSFVMALGIILCALSYYNAYGYILSCILLFTAHFIQKKSVGSGLCFDTRGFLKKGGIIAATVLLGIGWWFIRSAVLYDGDFLGLRARDDCASLYALPAFRPETRVTWQSQGFSIWEMLTESDFIRASLLSFIGIYGTMVLVTSIWVYRYYKYLFIFGLIACVIISALQLAERRRLGKKSRFLHMFWHLNMVFCIFMPAVLSVIYSYATDYQPQGRYIIPSLVPLCYYCVRGWEKLWEFAVKIFRKTRIAETSVLRWVTDGGGLALFVALLCIVIVGLEALTVYGYVFPYYDIY